MIRRLALVSAAGWLTLATPVLAGLTEDRAGLEQLQREDARLQSIGWRLATGNARFCSDAAPAIGLLLQDMVNYGEPSRMRAAAGISGDIAVQAVAGGSPAANAGIVANDEILGIDGGAMAALPSAQAGDWRRLTTLHDRFDASLATDGRIAIEWQRDRGEIRRSVVAGVEACPGRFELLDSGGKAAADGRRVLIGRAFAGVEYAEDEFAAALAHEYAHNLLGHIAWHSEHGRKRKTVRLTEREADRLMPWLLANAGYDPQAAVRFFKRWGPRHGGWIFRARDHDGWDERADNVAAELPQIRALNAKEGAADWQQHFRREIEP